AREVMANNGRSRMVKRLLMLLVAIAAIGGAIWYFSSDHEEPPQYQTARVTRGDLTQVVTATGQLNPVVNVQVGSQLSGNIQKLFVDFNSPVKENQIIAQIDPAISQAAVHQAEGDLANAKAALELAQVNASRSKQLYNDKV